MGDRPGHSAAQPFKPLRSRDIPRCGGAGAGRPAVPCPDAAHGVRGCPETANQFAPHPASSLSAQPGSPRSRARSPGDPELLPPERTLAQSHALRARPTVYGDVNAENWEQRTRPAADEGTSARWNAVRQQKGWVLTRAAPGGPGTQHAEGKLATQATYMTVDRKHPECREPYNWK